MVIIETQFNGVVAIHTVDNVTIGGEPVMDFVYEETGYAPYEAQPITPTRWITKSERY
jgi:hypothetical protein